MPSCRQRQRQAPRKPPSNVRRQTGVARNRLRPADAVPCVRRSADGQVGDPAANAGRGALPAPAKIRRINRCRAHDQIDRNTVGVVRRLRQTGNTFPVQASCSSEPWCLHVEPTQRRSSSVFGSGLPCISSSILKRFPTGVLSLGQTGACARASLMRAITCSVLQGVEFRQSRAPARTGMPSVVK